MPITREEALLNTMATGVASGVEPITREEQYLSYIAGETYTKPDAPITRKEFFLDKIPQGGSGGGGVTIRNQNKTITENGTYTADSGYTGLGTVTVDVQNTGSTGANKLVPIVDRTVTDITEDDLDGAEKIGQGAFSYCTKLKTVTLPNSITRLETGAFQNCSLLETANIPDSVTFIGAIAFGYCSSLKSIAIPSGVGTIETQTFTDCSSLESVKIGSSVSTIGMLAFSGCRALKRVTILAETPPKIQANTFKDVPVDCVYYVPTGCGNAYKSATNWSAFADQIVEEGAV